MVGTLISWDQTQEPLDGCIGSHQLPQTKAEVLHAKKVAQHTSSLLRPENFFCTRKIQKSEMFMNALQSLEHGFPEKGSFAVRIKNVNFNCKSCQQSLSRPTPCWQKLARTSFLGLTSGFDEHQSYSRYHNMGMSQNEHPPSVPSKMLSSQETYL